jgi:hypothetical protein
MLKSIRSRSALRRIASVVVAAALVGGVALAPGAAHAEKPPLPTVAQTEERLELLADFYPQEYAAAIEAVATYSTEDAEGFVRFSVPAEVVATLDPRIWQALLQHKSAVATYVAGDEVVSVDQADGAKAAALKAFLKWVSKNWSRIVSAAKSSGKYAWYKAHRCAYGAATKVYNASGGSMASVVAAHETYIYIAIRGCIAAL